jgi:hypothetical protein
MGASGRASREHSQQVLGAPIDERFRRPADVVLGSDEAGKKIQAMGS